MELLTFHIIIIDTLRFLLIIFLLRRELTNEHMAAEYSLLYGPLNSESTKSLHMVEAIITLQLSHKL